MDDIFPDEDLETVTVSGKETDAYGSDWRITAVATCADEPAGPELDLFSGDWTVNAIAICADRSTASGSRAPPPPWRR
jgi:hypothetical protein